MLVNEYLYFLPKQVVNGEIDLRSLMQRVTDDRHGIKRVGVVLGQTILCGYTRDRLNPCYKVHVDCELQSALGTMLVFHSHRGCVPTGIGRRPGYIGCNLAHATAWQKRHTWYAYFTTLN